MTKKDLEQLIADIIESCGDMLPAGLMSRAAAAVRATAAADRSPAAVAEFVRKYYSWLSCNGGKKQYLAKDLRAAEKAVCSLMRLDGFDLEEEIIPAVRWAVQDSFWSSQVRSLAQLRKKGRNGDSKFSNLFGCFCAAKTRLDLQPRTAKEKVQNVRSGYAAELLMKKYGGGNAQPGQSVGCSKELAHNAS